MTEKSPVKVIELIEVNGKHVSKEGGKRQYHHKSKNGCDNCKRRRVKCTEEKPSCSKCIKMNHECVYSKPLPRRRRTKKEIELSKKLEAGLIKEEDVEKELLDSQRSNSGHKSASRTSALLKVEEAVEADLINSNNFSDSSNVNRSHTSGSKFDSVGNSKNNSNSSTGSNRNAKVKYIVKREDGSIVTLNNDPTELKGFGDGNKNRSSGILNANAKNTSSFSGNNNNHHSLPQLMSLTSSEKYATAVSATGNDNTLHPNIKNNSQTNLNLNFQMNGGQNHSKNSINGLSSPQSNTMSMTNSIGTFFSLNNAKLLSNLTKNTKVETNNTSKNPSGLELQNQKSDLTFQSPNRSKDDKQLLNSPFSNMSSNVSSLIAGLNPKSAKMALANLPKLASAFGGGNKDDMTQSAMSFISMLSQGNKVTKPDSSGKSNGLPKDLQSKIDAIMKDLPKDAVNNLDTPNTLAGLASIGISIGNNPSELTGLIDSLQEKGKPVVKQNKPFSAGDAKLVNSEDEGSTRSNSGGNKATKSESSKFEENKNTKHEYSNFFNNFYNNNKMSMPSTPNFFQPAGIGGITYDFNELMNNQLTNGESVDVNQHKTALLTDTENMDTQSQTHMDKLKSPNSVMNQGSLLFNTPEILKSPILTPSQHMNDSTTSKDAFSRAHKDLKDEAVEVLSTMATVAQRDKLTANDNKNSPGNLFLVKPQDSTGSHHMSSTNSQNKLAEDNGSIDIEGILEIQGSQLIPGLNLIDLRLFQHYLKTVSKTIIESGICAASSSIWTEDIPDLAFEFPFLMHSILAFSATHLSRTESGLDEVVATHRLDCLKLLKDAVLEITPENTDALIASAIILIMDSLANAMPAQNNEFDEEGATSLSTSAWIFHVKGAATILTAVWPIPEKSRFYNLINVDLTELSQYFINGGGSDLKTGEKHVTDLACFDESIQDLYPVEIDSPYLITLAYLEKLNKGIDKDGFLLRIFSFPALLDKTFLFMLMTGDMNAMRIMRTYYKMLRSYVIEKKGNIWFLEGLTHVLPANVDEYTGGGVYMMLDFLGNGLPSMMGNVFGNDGGSGLLSALNFDAAFDPSDENNNNDMDK